MITFDQLVLTDFRVIKRATVPLDAQGLVLIRAVNEDTLAADSNGSGKSTIFHGFGWVLFGKLVGEERPTDIIRRGCKKATGEVTWSEGGTRYKVVRTQKSSAQVLELYVDDVTETGRSRDATQARIEELLGLDFDSFRNTVMYGQGDFKRFASPNVTDSERKKVMKRALNIGHLDGAVKHIRALLKEAREREHEAATLLTAARTAHTRAQADLGDTQEEHDGWQEEHDGDLEAAREAVSDIEGERAELEEQAGKVAKLEELEGKVQAVIDGRSDVERRMREHAALSKPIEERIKAAEAQRLAAVNNARSAQRDADEAERDRKREERQAATIREEARRLADMDICPTCHTPTADSTHTQAHLASEEERAQQHDQAATEHATARDKALARKEGHDDEAATAAAKKLEAQEELAAHDEEGKGFDRELTRIDSFKPKLASLREQLKAARAAGTKLTELDGRLNAARDTVKRLEGEVNPHVAALERATKAVEAAASESAARQAEVDAIQAEIEPLRFWEVGFGNTGIPSMALDAVLPIVTESANRYLDVLADGDIRVDIQPTRELATGGTKDEIDISVHIEGNDGVRPSGAQESKISIAIDLGLMDLVATREGSALDILMLDECLDGLDAEGKRRVFNLLESLTDHRSTILVVSHDDEVKERFETVWTVIKTDGAAVLETE